MKEHDCRVALRLPAKDRHRAYQLIKEGKFKNFSQLMRTALNELVLKEGEK
jgi:Arc/MetJ-type ribon-helix-helix transcriptional regulator